MMIAGLILWKLRDWWRDALVERARWLLSDLRADHATDWNCDTNEWLPAARVNIGSAR